MSDLEKRDALIEGFCKVIGEVLGEEFPKEDGELLLGVLESGCITVKLALESDDPRVRCSIPKKENLN